MGVVCVMVYRVAEGKSGQQTVDMLQKSVEELGAVKTGNFLVDCETYQSATVTNNPRTLHLLRNSEQPASAFCVLDTGMCLVADTTLELLMTKMKDFYAIRKNAHIESKGQRYELGDFIVKIGSCVLGQNASFKGILVEIEYCPSSVPNECFNLMKEFMQGFLGNNTESLPNHFKSKMDALYTPADTIIQYLEHFNNFRRAAAQSPR